MPNLDVLLLPVRGDGVVQLFAAAFADEHGARALTRRIREQLDRHQAAAPAGTTTLISYRMIPPVAVGAGADTEAVLGAMVREIRGVHPDGAGRGRHASIATTMNIYTHAVDASHRKAIEAVERELFVVLDHSGLQTAAGLAGAPPASDSIL